MKKTQFRSSALCVVKTSVDVEREIGKLKRKTAQALTEKLVTESVNAYLESGRNYISFFVVILSPLVCGSPI